MQSCNPNSTPNLAIVSVSRRKSFWKMVKNMIVPRKLLGPLAACGGIREKRRKRVERLKRGKSLTLERPRRFLSPTGSVDSPSIPPPPLPPFEGLIPPPLISEDQLEQCIHRLSISSVHNERSLEPTPPINGTYMSAEVVDLTRRLDLADDVIYSNRSVPTPRIPRSAGSESSESSAHQFDTNRNSDASSAAETENVSHAVVLRNKRKVFGEQAFDGWRKSSIEVTTEPPVTLQYIPSGLQVGDKVMWIADAEPQPERATVRWIGKIRGEYYAGIEFARKIGNSSGLYGYGLGLFHRLFTCELGYGRFVPVSQLVLSSDFHDKGSKAGFICVICRDDFLELGDIEEAEDESLNMVATKCGHLYHHNCLNLWLEKKKSSSNSGNDRNTNSKVQRCPHCQTEIREDDTIRLFPAQL